MPGSDGLPDPLARVMSQRARHHQHPRACDARRFQLGTPDQLLPQKKLQRPRCPRFLTACYFKAGAGGYLCTNHSTRPGLNPQGKGLQSGANRTTNGHQRLKQNRTREKVCISYRQADAMPIVVPVGLAGGLPPGGWGLYDERCGVRPSVPRRHCGPALLCPAGTGAGGPPHLVGGWPYRHFS